MKKHTVVFSLTTLLTLCSLASCGNRTPDSSTTPTSDSSYTSDSSVDSSVNSDSSADSSVSSVVQEKPMTGEGTEDDPFIPLTAKHLASLQDKFLTDGPTYINFIRDIDLGGEEWTPLGSVPSPANVFINGNGHTISGLSIKENQTNVSNGYGLFGGVSGFIQDLKVEGDIDVTSAGPTGMDGSDNYVYAGLLAGYSYNIDLVGVETSGSVKIHNDQDNENDVAVAGGIIGYAGLGEYNYTTIETSKSSATVLAGGDYGIAGGIIGSDGTVTSTQGILAINSCVASGASVTATIYAGGIAGDMSSFTSIVNSVSSVGEVKVTSSYLNTALAGGIAGTTSEYTAILFNVSTVSKITVVKSGTYTIGGDVAGYLAEAGYAYGTADDGCVSYGNLVQTPDITASQTEIGEHTDFSKVTDAQLASIGFGSAFTIGSDHIPALNGTKLTYADATLSVHGQGDENKIEATTFKTGLFNNKDLVMTDTKAGYNLINISYDKDDSSYPYQWYAPLNVSMDLYANWFDSSILTGYHKGQSDYNPVYFFNADGTLSILHCDYSSCEGTWWSNGEYLIIMDDSQGGVVATLNADGSFSYADVNDESYIYNYGKTLVNYGYYKDNDGHMMFFDGKGGIIYTDGISKFTGSFTISGANKDQVSVTISGFDSVTGTLTNGVLTLTFDDGEYPFTLTMKAYDGIPDYTGKGYVGTYHGNLSGTVNEVTLEADGNASFKKSSATSVYSYFGYVAYGNNLTIRDLSGGMTSGEYVFNASKKVLVKSDGKILLSQTGTFTARYATDDDSMAVFVFSDATYVVENGKLSTSKTVEGEIKDGGTIAIGGKEYTISGTKLTYIDPEPDVTPLVNTYTGDVGGEALTLVLNSDKTGTYNGTAITYTYDGSVVTFNVGTATVTLTFNSVTKTFTGTYTDGENSRTINLAVKTEEAKTIVGSWTGKVGMNTWTVILTADGKMSLVLPAATLEGTYTLSSGNTYDFTCGMYSGTLTFNPTTDKVSISADDDDYNNFKGELTRN